MRQLIFLLLLAVGGSALADDLAKANSALASRAYPEALALYGKLASTGNAEAQLRLGEMYWYGEGVALDRAKGDALFAQAAAAGNQEAVAAQSLSARRVQRSAAIAHWTAGYDGADLTAGKFACVAPTIPEVSITNADVQAATAAIAVWHACHDAFVVNLNASLPAGKAIPPDVAVVMSEQETQQAKSHLDGVYAGVSRKAEASATAILARRDKWQLATAAYVENQNNTYKARLTQHALERAAAERAYNQARISTYRLGR